MPARPYRGIHPKLAPGVYIDPAAVVIGDVELAADVSIWPMAVVRGEVNYIRVGARSNVQDGSVLHTDDGIRLDVGDDVTLGHQVMLHGCSVGDGSLLGIQAVVLNGAKIGRNCLVGAGALVTEGKEFPDGSLILGAPAKAVRAVTAEQIERLRHGARHYVDNAERHRNSLKRIA